MAREFGRILSGIGGNYAVGLRCGEEVVVKARGLFRKLHITPLIGDRVIIEEGFIQEIEPRKNETVRPAAANIDLLLIVFAMEAPSPHFTLLDRFLAEAMRQKIPVHIVFNKLDLVAGGEKEASLLSALEAYRRAGYEVSVLSLKEPLDPEPIAKLKARLKDKLTVLAGPSGVGKSSLINALTGLSQEVGELSQKIERGKNTTRHARLLAVEGGGYIADTPGFSTFYNHAISKEELEGFYPEFQPYLDQCYFHPCAHINEPSCGVKRAVEEGGISRIRYENYCRLYEEQEEKKL